VRCTRAAALTRKYRAKSDGIGPIGPVTAKVVRGLGKARSFCILS